ncbi:helix-turn-helix transcriptional regulator [Halogranum rubrum]|nr:helix-turn-helix domain-containing protein [Halogranum rubrum]
MATHGGLHITTTTYGGDAIVPTNSDSLYLWNTERFNANATIETGNASGNYRTCVLAQPVENESVEPKELDCRPVTFESNETTNLTFTELRAPNNATGEYDLTVVVDDALRGGGPVATNITTVTFLRPEGDLDNDGLLNREEIQRGTRFDVADTDNDTLSDGDEVDLGTNPVTADTDGDGLRDGLEASVGLNPRQSAVPFYVAGLVLLGVLSFLAYRRLSSRGGFGDGIASNGATAGTPTANGGAGPSTSSDADFITDEDRILQILSENGGRLMQSRLVELTDWSKSKVSRRLSTLEEEGRIRKITLGRENMVALPGHEPDGAQSPFEEEQ